MGWWLVSQAAAHHFHFHFHFHFHIQFIPIPSVMLPMCKLCRVKDTILAAMRGVREVVVIVFLAIFSMADAMKPHPHPHHPRAEVLHDEVSYCLSWRMSVEANNMAGWRTVPKQCLLYIESYMIGGQYDRDMGFIIDQILSYIKGIVLSDDGMDAWILDVDDTCISNLFYYKGKRFGCDPFDPQGFRAWALKGGCPAISAVLRLFDQLVESGFKVFLLTGRDEQTLGQVTIDNLHNQGFIGYERLILRRAEHKGQGAIQYKSGIRKQLVEEGYRIWGNVGDQWTDLQGDCKGNRTFKLPNPMYFVP